MKTGYAPRLRRTAQTVMRLIWRECNAILRTWWARQRLRDNTVLYESFAGSGALCNPEAIFRHLLESADMTGLHHTWVLSGEQKHARLRAEFAGNRRVQFVRRGTPAYFRALATRKYLVNNATFPPEFSKRLGQTYLNTWHGTPLKRMGYDMVQGGAIEAANTMRNFLSADFLLSQNEFMTKQMYETAYRLRGSFGGRILQEGYPRTDKQHLDESQRITVRARLEAEGIPLDGRRLVLYAPTWRGTDFSSPNDNVDEILATTQQLQSRLGPDRFTVILKVHQSLHPLLTRKSLEGVFVIPNEIPANEVLAVTDALVSDFSSIVIDYLPQPGPIVFFIADSTDYLHVRGTYFELDQLPGPVFDDIGQVADTIAQTDESPEDLRMRRRDWQSKYTPFADGGATRRIADIVFRGLPAAHGEQTFSTDARTSILIHLGSMRSNGVTSAALNLLSALDPRSTDVSVVFARPIAGGQTASNQERIPGHVRQFMRPSSVDSKVGRLALRIRFLLEQAPSRRQSHRQEKYWLAQWRLCFGDAQFDHIVDFDGYGPFWANLLLNGYAQTHSIWLHNDMAAEQHRKIRGRERLKYSLGAVFALYHRFDALVSVSPSLNDLNQRTLAPRLGVRPLAFTFARNLVDGARVLRAAQQELEPDGSADWIVRFLDPVRASKWVVTVGRLSEEKNQARLIRAFAEVNHERPDTNLLIIGDGPLRHELEALVRKLGLADCVFFAGYLANPFPAVAAANLFVLSSDYEGQPMVLLEAAILKRPIVAVNFATVRDAVPASCITVVDRNDAALSQGILHGIESAEPHDGIDISAYNEIALEEFRLAIGASEYSAPRPTGSPGVGRAWETAPHTAMVLKPEPRASWFARPSVTTLWIFEGDPLLARQEPLVARIVEQLDSYNAERFQIVGRTAAPAKALDALARRTPDIILFDIELDGTNGLELAREVRQRFPDVSGLIFLEHDEKAKLYRAICFGPPGFMMADIRVSRLPAFMRDMAKGRVFRHYPWSQTADRSPGRTG